MAAVTDDMEMEKIAEDELAKLQRQFRIMEIDRLSVTTSVQPTLRMQRNIITILNTELEKIMLELKLTKSSSNLMENARAKEKLINLLKEHEKYSAEVKGHKANIAELNFLLRQVGKEIKGLQSKGSRSEEEYTKTLTNQSLVSQLENRLNTTTKRFNSVNSENIKLRIEIDRLLRDRFSLGNLDDVSAGALRELPMHRKRRWTPTAASSASSFTVFEELLNVPSPPSRVPSPTEQSFNTIWKNQIKRLMDGKAQIMELVEQAIITYDQREEWCSKLDALKDKAAIDYRKHCLEVRELQRQLDHSLKLEEFLRTKGTVRLTAADAKAEAKRLELQEMEMQTYNNYCNILDAIKEFAQEDDVDKLIQEFTRREEENYALFNYVNEVNSELKNLDDSVNLLRINIDDERAKHEAKLEKQQDSIEGLQVVLEQKRAATAHVKEECEKSNQVLSSLLKTIHDIALSSECDSLPLLKLLGKNVDINLSNARLYIKSLEKKILEIVEVIKTDEILQRQAEAKERTPPSSRRRAPRTPRRSPRTPTGVQQTKHGDKILLTAS